MNELKQFNVLFLEDNMGFTHNTVEFLNLYFKKVFHSQTVKQALEIFDDNHINVIISDIKLKDGNGLEFIKNIRKKDIHVPIIVLSAHKDENFLLEAIPLNISSYQIKPISYEDFISVLELISQKFKSTQTIDTHNNIEFNLYTKELFINKKHINLTKKETIFIELLFKNKQIVVTHEMIQNKVWEDKIMSTSAIKNFILRIRKKINQDFLTTVHGVGYKLSY